MRKVLWIYTKKSSFVDKDIRLCKTEFDIEEFKFTNTPKWYTIVSLIKLLIHLLINRYDIIVCQFAGYQSLLPSLLNRICKTKVLIIAAGTDCVSIPIINYGNFNKKLLSWVTKYSFKNCSYISVVDETLVYQKYTYDTRISDQGIKHFIPDIKTPISVIHYGYDSKKWFRNRPKKRNTFLTVTAGTDAVSLKRKGIDMIYTIANRFPECTFIIIGLPAHFTLYEKKNNVLTIPFIPNDKLIDYYSEAEFYLQLSLMEGFPNALCEAMLCECIPIVSNVASMPKIVGKSGFILKKRNEHSLIELINDALVCNREELSSLARKQILNYPEEKRKQELNNLIEKIIHES